MSDVNLQPLFEYLDEKFAAAEESQKETQSSVNLLTNAVDNYLKQGEISRQEVLTMRLTFRQTRKMV